jgi:hypothetical protein
VADSSWITDAQPLIDAGLVETDRVAKRFFGRLAEQFPTGLNRIDWSRVAGALAVHCPNPAPSAADIIEFLNRVIGWTGVGPAEQVVLLGDSADVALWLTVPVLQAHTEVLLAAPQHYYLLPWDAAWCFNYTFEGDMYFGWAATPLTPPRNPAPSPG